MRAQAAPPNDLQLLEKLKHYCAYQERCHSEVKTKMEQLKIPFYKQDDFIAALISENFLNESRFAEIYSLSKLRQKNWGKIKIKMALQEKKVSPYCIQSGLAAIDNEEYIQILENTARKKAASLKEATLFLQKNKLADFLLRKGFESELVWPLVNRLLGD